MVGARLGKSGGSLIVGGLLFVVPNLFAATPYIAVIFLVIAAAWIMSVNRLAVLYNKKVDGFDKTEQKEAPLKKAVTAAG